MSELLKPSSNDSSSDEHVPLKLPDQSATQQDSIEDGIDESNTVFKYTSLEDASRQIRLLTISPGSWDDDIKCIVQTFDISKAPSYQAVSYTWGKPQPMSAITIDGRMLMVRQNCLYALRQARHRKDGWLCVWVDAVCINQSDLEEKGRQVMMMGDIFEHARYVAASIGPMTPCAAAIFDAAEEMACKPSALHPSRAAAEYFNSEDNSLADYPIDEFLRVWRLLGLETRSSWLKELAAQFNLFAQHEYWKRLWVVQELAMARKRQVRCGQRQVSMAALLSVHKLLYKVGDPHSSMLRSMDVNLNDETRSTVRWMIQGNQFAVMHEYTSRKGHIDLDDELYTLAEFQCDDPRDRIYGLLRLIKWPHSRGPPTPDYSVSPTRLAIDVIDRIGRHWGDFHKVHDLMSAVGVELKPSSVDSFASRSTALADSADAQPLKEDTQFKCMCAQPLMPRIALELRTHRFAVVYAAPEGRLSATIRTAHDPHEDIGLQQQDEPETGWFISKIKHTHKDKLRLILVSTVKMQPGDIILHLEHTILLQGHNYQNPTFCLVVRSPRQGFYQIVGQVEVHGECSLCFHFAGQKCPHEPCTKHTEFPTGFIFYVDAEDAVAYVLAGREDMGKHRLRNGGSLNGRVPCFVNRRFARSRYSSFALRADVLPKERYKRLDHMINGVPSLDRQSVICAECGGFFVPDGSFDYERTVYTSACCDETFSDRLLVHRWISRAD